SHFLVPSKTKSQLPKKSLWYICSKRASALRAGAFQCERRLRDVLTIAKMHGESVAYYESTVDEHQDENLGPDGYYSEDGTKPAEAWVNARTDAQAAAVAEALGVAEGEQIRGEHVRAWFNKAIAPSGVKLGRAPKGSGVPG